MSLPVRAALWFTVAGVSLKAVATLTTPIFTRLMSTEQFGLYSLYNSWFSVLSVITTFRLAAAVFSKGMSKYPDRRDAYAVTMQTTATALVLVVAVLYVVLRPWVDAVTGLSAVIMVAMLVELLFSPSVTFWTARERYDFNYRPVVLVTVGTALGVAVLGVLGVVLSEDKGLARIVAGAAVTAAVGLVVYVRNIKRAGVAFVPEYARFALSFNLPLVPHYLSMYVLDQLDRIMVARMVSLSAAAVYSVGYTVGLAIRVATDSISSALIPWQYRQLEAGNLDSLEKRLLQVFALYGVLVLLVVSLAPEFIAILGGEEYMGAVYVVPPVAVSTFFIFAYTIFGNIEVYYDSNQMMIYGSTVAAAVNVVLNVFLIPRFGYVAAAYTTLFCYAALAVAHYAYVRVVVREHADGGRIISGRALLGLSVLLPILSGGLIATYELPIIRYSMAGVGFLVAYLRREDIKAVFGSVRK